MPAVLNDEFYPILLMGFDEPFTAEELQAYLTKLAAIADEGIRTHKRHVVIVTKDPMKVSAAGRRRLAEAVERFMTPEQIDVTLLSVIPVDNALLRGVVTAFRWLSPETVKTLRLVPTIQAALDEALQALVAHGTSFTGDGRALRRALGLTK